MIALIDADELAYRACFAQEREIDWNDDGLVVTTVSALPEAIRAATSMIEKWTKDSRADRAVLCFSPDNRANFRYTVLPSYKGHRSNDKPEAYWPLVDYLKARYKFKCEPFLEADDLLGLIATHPKVDAIVCSQDKDIGTLPVRWYNPRIGRNSRVTEEGANRFWMQQTLSGDPADGYKGCPKIGEKKAAAALKGARNLPDMWQVVLNLYTKAKLSAADAIAQARCARILRHGDFDFTQRAVRLWRPSGYDLLKLGEIGGLQHTQA